MHIPDSLHEADVFENFVDPVSSIMIPREVCQAFLTLATAEQLRDASGCARASREAAGTRWLALAIVGRRLVVVEARADETNWGRDTEHVDHELDARSYTLDSVTSIEAENVERQIRKRTPHVHADYVIRLGDRVLNLRSAMNEYSPKQADIVDAFILDLLNAQAA